MLDATPSTPSSATRPIKPRGPEIDFETAEVPRYWFGGLKHATHLSNAVNLLFPKGERFFVRSVAHYLPRITDPVQRAQVKGFTGQEAQHARAHEAFAELMERQGFRLERFMSLFQRVAFDGIEKVAPPALRLSVTAASEHFTALFAEDVLSNGLIGHMDPTMAKLLSWHAAEEIEHKAVAFDVLKKVAPGYPLRIAGLGIATVLLGGFWFIALVDLTRQDAKLPPAPHREPTPEELAHTPLKVFARGILEYLRPSFHPDDNDNLPLAREALRAQGYVPA